jgi:N-acetylneuraminic acid mutarotase
MSAYQSNAIERLETRAMLSSKNAVPVMIVPIHGAGCTCMGCGGAFAAQSASIETDVFHQNVNFLPAEDVSNPEYLPEGYLADTGAVFVDHDGLEYGWSSDLSLQTRRRDGTSAPDGRYATHVQISNSDVWEMTVPNGTYKVRLVAGDAAYTNSVFKFDVEGTLAMDARPAGKSFWVERSVTVTVEDGKLTIGSAPDAVNNKLAFLSIASVEEQPETPALEFKKGQVSLPFHRVENGAVQIGSKLYVMGGFVETYWKVTNSFQVYDFKAKKWTTKGNMPGSQTHFALATDGRYIYKMAGQYGPMFSTSGTNEGWKYDTVSGKWTRMANLPAVRFGGAMEYLDGKLHYWGGNDATRHDSQSDHWTLDLASSSATWQPAPAMPLPGDHLSHAVLNGKIYSIGGEHDHGKTYVQHDFVFEYDPVTSTWSRKADMPTPASHFEAATFAYKNRIWAIGGQVDNEKLTSETRVYNPDDDEWMLVTALPEARKGGTVAIWGGEAQYISGDSALRTFKGSGVPRGSWKFKIPEFNPSVPPTSPFSRLAIDGDDKPIV